MPVEIRLNLTALNLRAESAFKETVTEYAQRAQEAFALPDWAWSGTTRRRNGEVAGSPRNVVDSGALRDSQQRPDIVGLKARITWDSDHAAPVFLGAVYRKRRYSLPARNLPLHVVRTMNFPEVFMRHFNL
jgi:hypothetical protein